VTRLACEAAVEPAAISALTDRVMEFLAQAGVDARCAHHVALMLDELLTNVATHGGGALTPAHVCVEVHGDRVSAEVLDSGAPFDPRNAREPDPAVAPADRPIGGLGLMLVRRLGCELDYERRADRNWTKFSMARAGRPNTE
jgi:serine/threonine-protein kinase RsbW